MTYNNHIYHFFLCIHIRLAYFCSIFIRFRPILFMNSVFSCLLFFLEFSLFLFCFFFQMSQIRSAWLTKVSHNFAKLQFTLTFLFIFLIGLKCLNNKKVLCNHSLIDSFKLPQKLYEKFTLNQFDNLII